MAMTPDAPDGTDGWTGEVVPGGPPGVRRLGCLTVTKISVDPEMHNNCYLLHCSETDEQVLVDAAAEAPRLLEAIGDRGLLTVITTHQHWDHHRALAEVVAATGAAVVAGVDDADAITEQTGVPVTRRVRDGDKIAVGACDLEVITLVGHTPGSIALLLDDPVHTTPSPHLFTGDSLFPGGVGNTRGDAAAFTSLLDDVETKLFGRLPDETWFYPGHGADSTLGRERPQLGDWRARGW